MADAPSLIFDNWEALRRSTTARVALGRVGSAMPTAAVLAFQLAQAHARDAVHASLATTELSRELRRPSICVKSSARNRETYLRRPDLGRCLDRKGRDLPSGDFDLGIILADGLSAGAVNRLGSDLVQRLTDRLDGWTIAPIILAEQARVAIGDEVGRQLGARFVVVLIGERPGLSAPESVGAYITSAPTPGRLDSERNCVSNIRASGGLDPGQAAETIVWLLNAARRLGFTGTGLKDRRAALTAQDLNQATGLTVPGASHRSA